MAKSKPRTWTGMYRSSIADSTIFSHTINGLLRDVYPDKKLSIQRIETWMGAGSATTTVSAVRIGVNVDPHFVEPLDTLESKHGVLIYDELSNSVEGKRSHSVEHAYSPPYELDHDDSLNVEFYASTPAAGAAAITWIITIVYTVSD